jgi:hypothetical protein
LTARDGGEEAAMTPVSPASGPHAALRPKASKLTLVPQPFAAAACTRFSAAQPRLTNRWWSSGSTTGQRREVRQNRNAVVLDLNRQHWVVARRCQRRVAHQCCSSPISSEPPSTAPDRAAHWRAASEEQPGRAADVQYAALVVRNRRRQHSVCLLNRRRKSSGRHFR